jgi:hypothetical protein
MLASKPVKDEKLAVLAGLHDGLAHDRLMKKVR